MSNQIINNGTIPDPGQSFDDWEQQSDDLSESERLLVDVDGFEGPLDLMLSLARTHKLDITKISMLELADQYLSFIEGLQRIRLKIAADYLVMASWLAFLKSKLLLPKEEEEGDDPSGALLAAQLAFRLQRLDAMRTRGDEIISRQQLGLDFFARGCPEPIELVQQGDYKAELIDLLKAYSGLRERTIVRSVKMKKRRVWSIKEARQRLEKMLGLSLEWAPIDSFLSQFMQDHSIRSSIMASTFSATLEMAREGELEIRQQSHFSPLYVRSKTKTESNE